LRSLAGKSPAVEAAARVGRTPSARRGTASPSVARDGEDALDQLNAPHRVDVLVVDADMGGEQDGLGVAKAARQRSPTIDVIYVSRIPFRIPEQAKVRGAPCVRSPYHPHQLASVIAALRHRPGNDEIKAVA
jgi:CheY-like chemotaxis protein